MKKENFLNICVCRYNELFSVIFFYAIPRSIYFVLLYSLICLQWSTNKKLKVCNMHK